MKFNKPKLKFWTVWLLVLTLSLQTDAKIHLSEDGGYSNIVLKISDDLDMNKCSDIIAGLKVRIKTCASLFSQVLLRSKIRVLGLNSKCFMACFLLASAKIWINQKSKRTVHRFLLLRTFPVIFFRNFIFNFLLPSHYCYKYAL